MFRTKINPEIIDYLRVRIGPVAQLNRASDSGSAGRGFESHRGHKNWRSQWRSPIFVTPRDSGTGLRPVPVILFFSS